MRLARLEADRLRNLRGVEVELPAGLSVLIGRNGQGKSSLLEAIYLLATGRSFRTRRQEELVCKDGGPLRVAGRVEGPHGLTKLTVVMADGERSLLVDGEPHELDAYLGRLDLVDLTAPRMDVLKGGPADRRKFLDRGIVGVDPSYLREIGEYRRVLAQRNALFRGEGARDLSLQSAQLDVWDERLAEAGSVLHRRRREYAMELATHLGAAERALFPEGGEIRLHYRPSPKASEDKDPAAFTETFLDALRAGRSRDRMLGYTHGGPHRDELLVELDGSDLRKFGSAGQIRAAMIALKAAKLAIVTEAHRRTPLFLMDDFDTDIDEPRARALAEFLHAGGFQAIVATSKPGLAQSLPVDAATLHVSGGEVRVG